MGDNSSNLQNESSVTDIVYPVVMTIRSSAMQSATLNHFYLLVCVFLR